MSSYRATLIRWGGPFVIAIAAGAMLRWTWGTWPDVLVDFGRELYVAWRLAEGEVARGEGVSQAKAKAAVLARLTP